MELLGSIRYWFAVAFMLTLPGAVIYWFVVHPFVAFWRRLGARTSLVILFGSMIMLAVALIPVRDVLLIADWGVRLPLLVPGLLLYIAAIVFQTIVSRQLTRSIMVGVPELSSRDRGSLLTDGIYGRTRNPRYLVIIVATLSLALMLNYAGLWLFFVILIPVLMVIVRLEEKELRERFGEPYEDYCRAVPRFLPRLGRSEG